MTEPESGDECRIIIMFYSIPIEFAFAHEPLNSN